MQCGIGKKKDQKVFLSNPLRKRKQVRTMSSRFCLMVVMMLAGVLAQQQLPIQAQNPDQGLIRVERNGRRIVLRPAGEDVQLFDGYSRDARNFLWAVRNVAKGGEVFLREGVYYVNRPLIVLGYQGKIAGAGMDRTRIVARGPLGADGQRVFPKYTPEESAAHLLPAWPYVFMFANKPYDNVEEWDKYCTDMRMEQLTITVEGRGPAGNYFGVETHSIKGAILVADSNPNYIRGVHRRVEHARVIFDYIQVIGQGESELIGTNLDQGIFMYGAETWIPASLLNMTVAANGFMETDHLPINAQVEITNCRIVNTLLQALGVESPMSMPMNPAMFASSDLIFPTVKVYPPASVLIANNVVECAARGTVNELSSVTATILLGPSGTSIQIRNNRFLQSMNHPIALVGGQQLTLTAYPQEANQVTIEYNFIEMVPGVPGLHPSLSGLLVADLNLISQPPVPSLFVTAQFNEFTARPGFANPLVEHVIGAGLVLLGNQFSGQGQHAVSLGNSQFPLPGGGVTYLPIFGDYVQFNSFDAYTHAEGGAHVMLGPASFQSTVIQPGATVLDLGNMNQVQTVEAF